MADNPTVAVRGEATREVDPELVHVTVTVEARDKDRQATLARLGARAGVLRSLLDRYADAIERRETSAVNIWPDTKRAGERVTAYRGSVSTTVTVNDFTVLGELIMQAASLDQTSVFGPTWSLRPDSAVYRETRHAAIADALSRAREYAQALGARLVRLVELADPGLSHTGPAPGRDRVVGLSAQVSSMAAEVPGLDLDPQRQVVYAAVEARFAISEPDVGDREPQP
jgi:uncharacterized protein YggE